MSKPKKYLLLLMCWICCYSEAQTLSMHAMMDSIRAGHPLVKMYDQEIRSMDEAAKGAKSWMAPEFSMGWWMTPYNTGLWKKDQMGTTGMGQYMIGGQQMLPNKKKQEAEAAYMDAMSGVAKEKKKASLNDLIQDSKELYAEWIILKKKMDIVQQNEKLLNHILHNATLRYKNGLEKMNAYYKAKAALGKLQNMALMYESEIREKKIKINTLMGRDPRTVFDVDTVYRLTDYTGVVVDTSLLYRSRSDLKAIDQDIHLTFLKQETERQNLKPQFGIRYDHMFGFGGLPMQFNLMGMLKLPIANWSSKMNKANMESLQWKANALLSQKKMMANEYGGMAYSMRNEWDLKHRQLKLYEQNIIPALKNNYQTVQLAYEQNTEELSMLFEAWDALNMVQLEYVDLLGQLMKLQIAQERIMEILE